MQRRVGSELQRPVVEAAVGREGQALEPHRVRPSAGRAPRAPTSLEPEFIPQRRRQLFGDLPLDFGELGGEFRVLRRGGDQRFDVERVGLADGRALRLGRRGDLQPLDPAIRAESRNPARANRLRASRDGRRAGNAPASRRSGSARAASGRPPAAA